MPRRAVTSAHLPQFPWELSAVPVSPLSPFPLVKHYCRNLVSPLNWEKTLREKSTGKEYRIKITLEEV